MDPAEAYERYAGDLIRFATGLVGPSDAEDVVSNAMLRVLGSRRWPQVEHHRAYLYQAVANQARSFGRSSMRRRAREHRVAVAEGVEDRPSLRPDVLEAVAELSVRQRAVVFLTYWEDLDEATVAERLGIGRGSVRQHLGRARKKLRSVLHA